MRGKGPSFVHEDGSKFWFKDDKFTFNGKEVHSGVNVYFFTDDSISHRIDGPAIEEYDGYREWWVDGKEVTQEMFEEMSWQGPFTSIGGRRGMVWKDWQGKFHRTDGPSVEMDDGHISWNIHGVCHREPGHGATVIHNNGKLEWRVQGDRRERDGVLHRTDGPAVVYLDGTHEYWVDGRHFSEEEFKEMSWPHKLDEGGLNERTEWHDWKGKCHRLDGPAIEHSCGIKQWMIHDEWHRTDGPARELDNGAEEWYVDGKLHRLDGPAVTTEDGDQEWWVNGQRHRLDGPAVVECGGEEWYVNGKLHREDGPARHYATFEEWYFNDELHRTTGPAVQGVNGDGSGLVEYWVNGIEYPKEEFKEMSFPSKEGPWVDWEGKPHRLGGPSFVCMDGSEYWHRHGQLHREDGPAITLADGFKQWNVDGKIHRIDGPALITASGQKLFFLDGKEIKRDNPVWPNLLKAAIATTVVACWKLTHAEGVEPSEEETEEIEEAIFSKAPEQLVSA